MRTRTLGLLAAVGFLLVAPAARATMETPHDQAFSNKVCDNCHGMFVPTPTGKADFSPGCTTCHNNLSNPSARRGFPWAAGTHDAVPGERGNQHNWSGYATNKEMGANGSGVDKIVDGKLTCVTCHNIHADPRPQYKTTSKHISIPIGVAQTRGSASLTLMSTGTNQNGWRVKVQTVGGAGGTFILSHDWTLTTPTWFKWDPAAPGGGAWVPGTGAPTDQGKQYTNGADVTLDDNVTTVRIANAVVGDYWDFTVSYPALRITNVGDGICYACHAERSMNHVRASGQDPTYLPNGSRLFSHPVNVSLRENGETYDRLEADVLDPDGSTSDAIPRNDLVFDSGKVRCTTCHAVHNGNSNSLSD
jgi:hypothetical protein